ncbi:hypothetical protein DESC_780448 [Desulfosarcina cetonica]|nr:hypothetical protein DESC_780448 [Desulfosarcina cetonica]
MIHPQKVNGVLTELIDYQWEEFKKEYVSESS